MKDCSYLEPMKNQRSLWVVLLSLILFSCKEGDQPFFHKEKIMTGPFVFKMDKCFGDEEYNLSFPNWFDDSIIKEYKIQTLTRNIYSVSDEVDTTDLELRETRTYSFSKNGRLNGLQVTHYYDNQEVGSINFNIKEVDEYGYANVTTSGPKLTKEKEEIFSQYKMVSPEKYTHKYLAYHDAISGDYLFYVIDEEMYGPLSVDSILHPTKQDRIVLGSPRQPKKKYRVENTVNEADVVDYSYQDGYILKISFDEYPFHIHRHINYDEKGRCVGFVDSTFSDDQFLTERTARFEMDKTLPSKLIHENNSGASETGYYQIETFEYTFYP